MRTKVFFVVFIFVMASLLAACTSKTQVSTMIDEAMAKMPTQQAPIVNVTVPEQPAPVVNVEVPEQPAPVVNVEAPIVNITAPDLVEPEPQEQFQEAELPDCPLEDQGLRIDFTETLEKENGFYNLSSKMKQLAQYAGCNILIEGRQSLTREHHIWVFDPGVVEWELPVREASLWVYPINWNMDDFSVEKPPIATEFAVQKKLNMLKNGYEWPIILHMLNGNTATFAPGEEMPVINLPDNADFTEPEPLVVQGVWDGEVFNASIGAEKATTVALLDGQLVFWVNAQDNVIFSSVQAWLMPSAWSEAQVKAWAEAQFPGQTLQEYAP